MSGCHPHGFGCNWPWALVLVKVPQVILMCSQSCEPLSSRLLNPGPCWSCSFPVSSGSLTLRTYWSLVSLALSFIIKAEKAGGGEVAEFLPWLASRRSWKKSSKHKYWQNISSFWKVPPPVPETLRKHRGVLGENSSSASRNLGKLFLPQAQFPHLSKLEYLLPEAYLDDSSKGLK